MAPELLLLLLVLPLGLLAALVFRARPRAARIPLRGRHVFITGGSSGIGLALATAAAREGAWVSILARNASRLEDARAAIKAATEQDVGIHKADVRDATAVARAIEEAGPIDVLVCNHGKAHPGMKAHTRETGLPASIAIMSSQAGQGTMTCC